MRQSLILLSSACVAASFTCNSPVSHRRPTFSRSSRSSIHMGGGTGYATTLAGKKDKVTRVKTLLDSSELIFKVPADSLSVPEMAMLRNSLPETTTAAVVKNKLFNIAAAESDYSDCGTLLKGSNLWFFIEDDLAGTVKALNAFRKESGKEESHTVLGGMVDGGVVTPEEVIEISKLPSKIELITKIACGIKAVPTKIARVVNQPGTKVARAIKLATMPEEE